MAKCKLFKVLKGKNKKYRVGSYFRELSVVIIGVAVTFYVSGIIESNREQQDIKLQLSTIYDELSYNRDKLVALYKYYDTHEIVKRQLYAFVETPDKVDNDSLNAAARLIGKTHVFVYKRGAYGLFEVSGVIKSFRNRALLLKISDCYALLERCKENYLEYSNLKLNEIQKLYNMNTEYLMKDDGWINIPEARGIFNFYLMVSREANKEDIREIEEVLKEIKSYIN
ncbi:hypothetical protein D0T50_10000 [Bacteroides sp. 214]|uniref:hypothetical protein n=1 Tax=Bacteroides sp. 214 TaxID=2302935 RepID=UPI0013CFBBF5|nr:hypothetical protein [Bacteroides sp. 214]NDW13226.1 hypothetical protein [Bacteroides sp. 214]